MFDPYIISWAGPYHLIMTKKLFMFIYKWQLLTPEIIPTD